MPISSITVRRLSGLLFISLLIVIIQDTACTKPALTASQQTEYDSMLNIDPPLTDTVRRDTMKPLPALELLNEHYGPNAQQVMDIYLPAGRTPEVTHIMVFIHGGGWMGSDKQDYTPHINNMKNRDASYAYLNINYRLVKDGKNTFPAAEEDINAALEYMWRKADSFHISKATGLIGNSAGAHLTALQALKHNKAGNIKSAVCMMGVYDMKRFYEEGSVGVPQLTAAVLGGTPQEKPDLYHSSSPLYYVTPQSIPMLLMHGTEDTLARYSQALALDSALRKAGVEHELYSFKGWHAIPADVVGIAADKMFAFIRKHVK